MRLKVLAGSAALCAVLASCSTGGVSDLTPDSAVLHGSILTSDAPASFVFQYATSEDGLGTGAGWVTPRRTIPAGPGETPVSEKVTGLGAKGGPHTRFVYRLCVRVKAATEDKCLDIREFSTPYPDEIRQVFNQPGTTTVTVPAGVHELSVDAAGGAGGKGIGWTRSGADDFSNSFFLPTVPGGKGASVSQTIPVEPGDRLVVRVGSAGGDAIPQQFAAFSGSGAGGKGGTNGTDRGGDGGDGAGQGPYPTDGGGAGGGAPTRIDRLSGGRTQTVLVAGGGGGAGGAGGAGNGTSDDGETPGGAAGDFGRDGVSFFENGSGRGGGTTAAGAGGSPGGATGSGFDGGAGGSNTERREQNGSLDAAYWGRGGGGGGGGWHGAGGGGSGFYEVNLFYNSTRSQVSSGGGGGSSFAVKTSQGGSPGIRTGARAGDGIATLTFSPAPASAASR